MTCKASPAVIVDRVTLHESPTVTVQTLISGLDGTGLTKEYLRSFVKVVCVLSVYNPDGEEWRNQWITSDPPNPTPANALDENIHWTFPDWYSDAAVKDYVIGDTGDTNKTDGDGNIKHDFTIDLTGLIVNPNDISADAPAFYWALAEYLKYFVYVQVDTQQLAEQYGITIADEYNGVSGEYSSGEIISSKNVHGEHIDGTGREWINDYRIPLGTTEDGCKS